MPKQASYYLSRGFSYHHLKDYTRAREDFDSAIALNAQEETFLCRAVTSFLMKEYQQALEDYQRVSASHLKQEQYYSCFGYCWLQLKDYTSALQAFDQAIARNQQNSDFYFYRWACYLRLQKYTEALQEVDSAIALNPEKAQYYHGRGYIRLHMGELEQGRADFLLACQHDPASIGSGWMIEWCDMCSEPASQGTAERLTSLASPEDTDSLAHVCRGAAFWFEKHFEDASNELEQAACIKPRERRRLFLALYGLCLSRT